MKNKFDRDPSRAGGFAEAHLLVATRGKSSSEEAQSRSNQLLASKALAGALWLQDGEEKLNNAFTKMSDILKCIFEFENLQH